MLRRLAERDPQRPFVQFMPGVTLTAGELLGRALRVAGGLLARGLAPGDRAAIVLGNSAEYLETWFACHLSGIIAVPLNTALRGESMAHPLRLVDPSIVICDQGTAAVVTAAMSQARTRARLIVAGLHAAQAPLEELRGDIPADLSPADPADACCVMFTSGTTGPSKGVTWSPGMTEHIATVVAGAMRYRPDDTLYTCLPLFHGNALATSFLPALWAGSRIAVSPRFSASRFWDDIHDSGATATNILGVMSPILIKQNHPLERDHKLERALVIPAPQTYHDQMRERFGIQIVEAYGQVDVGMVLWDALDEPTPGSCGRATPGYELRLVDDEDVEVPTGEVGELVVRWSQPNTASPGYWGMPEATLKTWRNLWFHTGDTLRRDGDGRFYFVDRKKDAIRRRGENISSYEVETAILEHPDVEEAAAYAVRSDLSEDEVAVAVVPRYGTTIEPLDLIKFVEPRLPYFAVPRYVRMLAELPKTQTEKIQKFTLKRDGITADTWDREAVGYVVAR